MNDQIIDVIKIRERERETKKEKLKRRIQKLRCQLMISKIWNPIPRGKFSPISFNPYVPQFLKDYKLKKKIKIMR